MFTWRGDGPERVIQPTELRIPLVDSIVDNGVIAAREKLLKLDSCSSRVCFDVKLLRVKVKTITGLE